MIAEMKREKNAECVKGKKEGQHRLKRTAKRREKRYRTAEWSSRVIPRYGADDNRVQPVEALAGTPDEASCR